MAANRMAARVEPTTVPMPPRMLTPPTTEAVMMVSSRLGGTVDWITAELGREQDRGDAGEGAVDQEHLHDAPRRCEMPASRAASALPPTA